MPAFTCNERHYAPPSRPIAVLCLDGCADEYLSVSIARGVMPRTAELAARGYRGLVRGALLGLFPGPPVVRLARR